MADDVTKKDLQGVEARVTKKITDLQKSLEDIDKKRSADGQELDKIIVNVKHAQDAKDKEHDAQIKELQNTVANHAKLITELQNRKTSLF